MSESANPLLLALYEPDIAQNAGAMMRTCACLGVDVAVIEPAGFRMADSRFRRAGMDYLSAVRIASHNSWTQFELWRLAARRRLVLLTTKGETDLWDFAFAEGDVILVGRESAGVPEIGRSDSRCAPANSHPAATEVAERRSGRRDRARRGAAPDRTAARPKWQA